MNAYTALLLFISGGIFISFLISAYIFYRFWLKTKDSFFASLSLAFVFMSLERVLLATVGQNLEMKPHIYLMRLIAFIIIIYAIYKKNLQKS